jgi:DNA polymerase-3 subunit delta'
MSWDMIGHQWAEELLRSHITTGTVRHAYLFTGPDSVGKRTLALRFAQALNCEAPPASGGICGTCRACMTTSDQAFPDLHVVEVGQLDEVGELDQVSSQVKVKQIRNLQRQLALAPYEGRWRIALLLRFWEASESAANALLKTLEEPAPQVILLLTARSTESLLPTIVSRCEVIPLRALAKSDVESGLIVRGEGEERARLLAGLSAGRPGWAIRLAEDPEMIEKRDAVLSDLLALLNMDRVGRFRYAAQFRPSKKESLPEVRERVVGLLENWLSFWRDVLILVHKVDASSQNPDYASAIESLASNLTPHEVVTTIQSTRRTLQAVHQYANIQLAMEAMLLDVPTIDLG